jgi:hypothetical protein
VQLGPCHGDAVRQDVPAREVRRGAAGGLRGHDARGVVHLQRCEDVAPHVIVERQSAHDLDEAGQDGVVGVEVLEPCARLLDQAGLAHLRDAVREVARLGSRHLGEPAVRQSAGVVQQLGDGDVHAVVGDREVRQVAADRRVEPYIATLDELHHGQRRERLAQRADEHWRARGHGPAITGAPVGPQMDHVLAVRDRHREAREAVGGHRPSDEAVDVRAVDRVRCRRGSRPRGRHRRPGDQQREQRDHDRGSASVLSSGVSILAHPDDHLMSAPVRATARRAHRRGTTEAGRHTTCAQHGDWKEHP